MGVPSLHTTHHSSAKEVQFVKENHFIVRVVDVNCMA